MRRWCALLCYLTILLAVGWWAWSTSEWLLFGLVPVLLLDRHAFRLLPWTEPAAFPTGLLLRVGACLAGTLAIAVGFWDRMSWRESVYVGTAIGLLTFVVELVWGQL